MSHEINPDWLPPAYAPSDDIDTTSPAEQRGPRRTVWVVAAVVALVCIGAAVVAYAGLNRARPRANPASPTTTASVPPTTASPAAGAPALPCGPDEATAVQAAVAQLPPDARTGRLWNSTPEGSNFDPCVDLSAVVVTVQDATNSSPDQALMFHRGNFVGTATPVAYPFTSLVGPASTGDIVVLTYRAGQTCDVCEDGTLTIVGYQWQGDHVQMLDQPPEMVDFPP